MTTTRSADTLTQRWETKASDLLVGRTIRSVFYMSKGDVDEMGWYGRPVVLELDNGWQIIPQADDEGNDGGALVVGNETTSHVLPLL